MDYNSYEVMDMKGKISQGIIFLSIIIVLLVTSGCQSQKEINDIPVHLNQKSRRDIPIELYIQQTIKLGKYEPEEGIYLGAYVEKNKNIDGDITTFEKVLNQSHTFKVFQYTAKSPLSSQAILKCMAQRKVPYIKILLGKDFDLNELYQMITDIKAPYSIPVFIELFPLTQTISDPIRYRDTFNRAHEILNKYLDEVVIVWGVDQNRVYDMPLYYPGDSFVDWVGLNIYVPKYKNQSPYTLDILEQIDFWYKNFQQSKPMMLSSLAVSHFSTIDHTYTLHDAQNKLEFFYKKIPRLYPRIKSISYIDVNMEEVVKDGQEDYRITSQKQLTGYMKQTFKDTIFLDTIEEDLFKQDHLLSIKYAANATAFNDEIYLAKEYIDAFFKKVPLSKIQSIEDLDGKKYYKLEDIKAYQDFYYTN